MYTRTKFYDLTEASIQNVLFRNLVAHKYITPNTLALGYESDLVSITPSGFLIEYEIKISASDFKADMKKTKHGIFRDVMRSLFGSEDIPNRFYFVVPEGLVKIEEVPEYAGLIEIKTYKRHNIPHCALTVKKAPLLHKEKTSENIRTKLATTLMWKVHKQREKLNGVCK